MSKVVGGDGFEDASSGERLTAVAPKISVEGSALRPRVSSILEPLLPWKTPADDRTEGMSSSPVLNSTVKLLDIDFERLLVDGLALSD